MKTFEQNITQDGWTFFLISALALVVLFFVQKYLYLLDKKLSGTSSAKKNWQGKPWPLLSGLALGLFLFMYNVFSAVDITLDLKIQNTTKLLLFVFSFAIFAGTVYESILHFDLRKGTLRTLIYMVLTLLFFYAGLFTGYVLMSIIAFALIAWFFVFFKKLLT